MAFLKKNVDILDNQVVMVKSISSSFKLILSKQKAYGVIERICNMNSKKEEIKHQEEVVVEESVPELVIGPKEETFLENKEDIVSNKVFADLPEEIIEENTLVLEPVEVESSLVSPIDVREQKLVEEAVNNNELNDNANTVISNSVEFDSSIFETTVPF